MIIASIILKIGKKLLSSIKLPLISRYILNDLARLYYYYLVKDLVLETKKDVRRGKSPLVLMSTLPAVVCIDGKKYLEYIQYRNVPRFGALSGQERKRIVDDFRSTADHNSYLL